jgi:type II secretory pathway pseudopilin PulG
MVVGALAVAAAFWFLAISPKRKEASDVSAQITTAQQTLETAQAAAASAQAARDRYARDYATVARLGKAVPVQDDVPALVYQLESTADHSKVDFRRITLVAQPVGTAPTAVTQTAAVAAATGSSTTPAAATTASAAPSALPPGAAVGAAGFPTMPFSFDFQGSFFGMQKFLNNLNKLTAVRSDDSIAVKGRLMTVDGVALKAGPKGFPQVLATVSATAYLLPADEGLTAGATATTPGAATASTTTSTPPATTSLKGSN